MTTKTTSESAACQEPFHNLGGRAERSTHTSGASRFGSAAVAASALLGWLTACDVSHFRLDSTEHGAPPFFSPSPAQQPSFNACPGSGHSNAATRNPRSHPLPDLRETQMGLRSRWNDTVGTWSWRFSYCCRYCVRNRNGNERTSGSSDAQNI